jgi:UDP-glucose 4-epimerase
MIAKSKNSNTVFCGTRYGNVMASRGSVIPLFVNQIKNNKPITITNPDMTRFMMTVDDAIDLVLFAFENGLPGDIFVQKAPAATIKMLAEAIKSILNSNNPIINIGTRHGEKVFENLLTSEEMSKAIDLGNYYRIPSDGRDLNYDITVVNNNPQFKEGYTSHNTHRLNMEELILLLNKLDLNNME